MVTEVILPALGLAQDSGRIVEWLKAEGQHVTAGEALVVIETDKAAVDLEAPATGILARVSARPGDEVPVAQVIAVILSPEESVASAGKTDPAPSPGPAALRPADPSVSSAASDSATAPTLASAPASASAPPHATDARRPASPKARRLAAERGVDLAALRGSGPSGAVVAADVMAAAIAVADDTNANTNANAVDIGDDTAVVVAGAPHEAAAGQATAADEPPMSTVWRLMAERTTQSWTTVPHFFLLREAGAEGLIAWRERAQRQVT